MQLHNSCHRVKTCNSRRLTCDHPTIRSVDSSGGLVAVVGVGVVEVAAVVAIAVAVMLVTVVVHSSPRHQT